jgi:hypothetical protein
LVKSNIIKHGIKIKILVGELEWKEPLGRPQHSWEDNINMDLN